MQLAGMTNYYNTKNWSSIHLTHDEEKGRVIALLDCDNGQLCEPVGIIPTPDNVSAVYLKTIVSYETYHYSYSFDGKVWIDVGHTFDSLKLSDDYTAETQEGFFTGAFVGMFAIDTSGARLAADFDFFSYEERGGKP